MRQMGHKATGMKWVAVMVLLLILGCTKDEVVNVGKDVTPNTSNLLQFNIGKSSSWAPDIIGEGDSQTKSHSVSLPLLNEDGSETGIYISMVEDDMPAVVDTVATRSDDEDLQNQVPFAGIYSFQVPYSGDNIPADYEAETEGITTFMDNVILYDNGDYSGGQKFWPADGNYLKFFAYSPYYTKPAAVADGGASVDENYVVTTVNNQPTITYTVPTNAAEQLDILEATTGNLTLHSANAGSTAGGVQLNFNHLLSMIEIEIGNVGEGTITEVKLTDIKHSGTRKIGNSESSVWILKDPTSDYSQSSIYNSESNSYSLDRFYMMPQTLTDDAQIVVTVNVGSRSYALSRSLNNFIQAWNANKKYKYIISTPHEIDVVVSDVVEGNKKSNLQIKNTGLSSVYVRAAIIGNWVMPNETDTYEDDRIVASWDPVEEGAFDWGTSNGGMEPSTSSTTGWCKYSDGFYYHLNPVLRGNMTASLFESYVVGSAPFIGAVLDMTIIVQAVYLDDVSKVWPEEIVNKIDIN